LWNVADFCLRPLPPVPFSPALDQLQALRRKKDSAVEDRIRPKSLPSSLPPEAEQAVDDLLKKRGVVSKCASEQVSHGDLARLRPREWLNDEVINFYGALIQSRSDVSKENVASTVNGVGSRAGPLNVHYFSSFFWHKLDRDGYEKGRLAKWTKKVCSSPGIRWLN
jgi:sentrin-specific protease 1